MTTDKASAEFGLHRSLDGGDTGQGMGGTQEFLTVEVHTQDVEKTGYELSTNLRTQFNNTEQLHDGRWLWIRISSPASLADIKKILQMKRKPKQF